MTKLSQVVLAVHAGDWALAFRIAAKFPQLGPEKAAIVRAHEVLVHPEFYREMGKDIDAIIMEGKAAIYAKYGKALSKS
jgi:hypothetical protein